MKVNVDIHFGYGAVASFALAVGLLTGLYINEAVSVLFYLLSTLAYIAFHFLAMWVHSSSQQDHMDSMVQAQREDEVRQAMLEHEPIELLPMGELSSLRRAQ